MRRLSRRKPSKIKALALVLAGVILCIGAGFAVTTARGDTFNVTTFPLFNDGTHFVGPEFATLNGGSPFLVQCVDISHTIGIPASYSATVYNLNGNLTGLRFFDGSNTDAFLKVAFLFTLAQSASQDTLTQSLIQRAIWDILPHDAGQNGYLEVAGALTYETQASAGILGSGFLANVAAGQYTFISPDSADTGQLFVSQVPEPSTYAMAGVGLLALIGFHRMRNRKLA